MLLRQRSRRVVTLPGDPVNAASPVPEMLDVTGGKGLYKLGYVTADVDKSVAEMSERYGMDFIRFDPGSAAWDASGRREETSFRCAFSRGRNLLIELMQPVAGLVAPFKERVIEGSIVFHHIGVLVDDLEAVKARLPEPPVLESKDEKMAVTYSWLPLLEHYVEHVQFFGDGDRWLRSVMAGE